MGLVACSLQALIATRRPVTASTKKRRVEGKLVHPNVDNDNGIMVSGDSWRKSGWKKKHLIQDQNPSLSDQCFVQRVATSTVSVSLFHQEANGRVVSLFMWISQHEWSSNWWIFLQTYLSFQVFRHFGGVTYLFLATQGDWEGAKFHYTMQCAWKWFISTSSRQDPVMRRRGLAVATVAGGKVDGR